MEKIFAGLMLATFTLGFTYCGDYHAITATAQQTRVTADESSADVMPLIEDNLSFRILGTIDSGEAVLLGRMKIEQGADYNFDIRFGINMGGVYIGLSPHLYEERFFTNGYEADWLRLMRNGGQFVGDENRHVYVYIIVPESSWVVDIWGNISGLANDIMNDAAITYEVARQIAIDYAGIARPDVANLRSIMNLTSGDIIWDFAVAGEGLMVSVQIDYATGEIVRSQRFDGVWPAENFPVSFDDAVQIAVDYANISTPFAAYFHGHTTLPNGNQF